MAAYSYRIHALKALIATLVVLTSLVAAPTASAELADDTGRYGVSGVDTTFGLKPYASVASMESIGNTIYVGGKFTTVTLDGQAFADHPYLAAFDATTGEYLPGFDAELDGPVNATEVYDGKLLIGGKFTKVGDTNRPALALIDPTTGQIEDFPFKVNGGSPASVRGFDLSGGYLYATGIFNRGVGNGTTVSVKGAVRFNIADGTVDTDWKPRLTGSGWGIAADPDNGRVYVAAFQTGGLVSLDDSTGRTVRSGFGDGTGIGKPYDVLVHEGQVWIVGSEHELAILNAQTLRPEIIHISGRAGQANPWNGGEYQVLELVGDRIYTSCRCNYEAGIRGSGIVEPISYLLAYDANTGQHIPSFDPHILAYSGGWAITEGPDGCIWAGGDFRKSGSQRVNAFAKLCDITNFGNETMVDLSAGATTTQGNGWFEIDLGSSQPIRTVEVHANIGDNFIIVSNKEFPNGKTGAQVAGAEGYHGTRMIRNLTDNERYFNTYARYVRVYTNTRLTASQVEVFGRIEAGADTERPSNAKRLTLTTQDSDVELSWEAATDNVAVTGYRIFRQTDDGGAYTMIGTSSTTSYTDSGLDEGEYSYYLRAYDAAGNVGWRNQIRTITVAEDVAQPDTTRPSTPRGLRASEAVDQTVTLTWTASTDNVGVTQYTAYTSDGVLHTSTEPTMAIAGLDSGQTYEIWVRAQDAAENNSWRTNRVTVVVP